MNNVANSEINFYVDTLIVEAILSNNDLSKTAGQDSILSQLVNKLKSYFNDHIDPNDKSGSLLNLLAPGAIATLFSAMGFRWLGILFGLAIRVFNIDVKSILSSIWSQLKGIIGDNKQTSSAAIDNIVNSAVQEHVTPATEDEANKAVQLLDSHKSAAALLRDAKMLKLALIEFDKSNIELSKTAGFFSAFSARKKSTANLLSIVLRWIFKIALASAGLMVAGDVINKFLGRPNALDGTIQNGKVVNKPSEPNTKNLISVVTSTQTKFKLQPSYSNYTNINGSWIENIPNNEASIEDMLITFTKQVYQGLDGLENIIRSTPGLQIIKNRIYSYNSSSRGTSMVFIPKNFTSKKQMVDMFIDDVAQKAP